MRTSCETMTKTRQASPLTTPEQDAAFDNALQNRRVCFKDGMDGAATRTQISATTAAYICGFGTDKAASSAFIRVVDARQEKTGRAIWLPGKIKILTLRRIYDHLGDLVDTAATDKYFRDTDALNGWNVGKISGYVSSAIADSKALKDTRAAQATTSASVAALLQIVNDMMTRIVHIERDLELRQRVKT